MLQCVCRVGYRTETVVGPETPNFRCVGCTSGTFSSQRGATSCNACPTGKYGNSTLGVSEIGACVLCLPGTFAESPGVALACPVCGAGYYSSGTGASQCTSCLPGKYIGQSGALQCQNCSQGSYSSTPSASQCAPCAKGLYSSLSSGGGASTCQQCPPGAYSDEAGGTSCKTCAAGTYSSVSAADGAAACLRCSAGKYSTASGMTLSSGCTQCDAGTTSSAGAVSCVGCGSNTFADTVNGGCLPCPPHSGTGPDHVGCLCGPGYYHWYNTKALGGDMSYSEDFSGRTFRNHVYPTGKGTLAVIQATYLKMQCAGEDWGGASMFYPGTYPVDVSDPACSMPLVISYRVNGIQNTSETSTYFQCAACPPGTYSDYTGVDSCTMCLPTTYQDASGGTACKDCIPGTISGDGMDFCNPCPANTYEKENDCASCPSGKYSTEPGAAECVSCPPNTWSDATSIGCKQCPSWSLSAGQGSDCVCYEGLYMHRVGASISCMQCPTGSYSPSDSNVCSLCPTGKYGDRMAMGACTACPSDSSALRGSTVCTPCVTPQTPSADGSVCEDCPQGMVCTPSGEVLMCPPGTYGAGTGVTSIDQCLDCPPNKVCTDAKTVESCPPNTHSAPQATSMHDCECDYGFDCTYTKSVRGKVVLPISPEDFDSVMRDNFVQAIAEAAGILALLCVHACVF